MTIYAGELEQDAEDMCRITPAVSVWMGAGGMVHLRIFTGESEFAPGKVAEYYHTTSLPKDCAGALALSIRSLWRVALALGATGEESLLAAEIADDLPAVLFIKRGDKAALEAGDGAAMLDCGPGYFALMTAIERKFGGVRVNELHGWPVLTFEGRKN